MECSICIYAEKEKKKREKMLVSNVIRILDLIEFENYRYNPTQLSQITNRNLELFSYRSSFLINII